MNDTKFVGGVQKLSQRIAHIRATLFVPALVNELGELLLRRTLDRFDREVDPDGRDWAPLKESTLARRRRDGKKGSKKLFVTGAMRGDIKLIRGSAIGAIATNTGAGVRIGVTDPAQVTKAGAHNYGRGSPQRRFLGIGRLDIKSVDSFMRRRSEQLGN